MPKILTGIAFAVLSVAFVYLIGTPILELVQFFGVITVGFARFGMSKALTRS